jgi:hypothetical protein
MSEPARMAAIAVTYDELAAALGFPEGTRILRVVDAGETLQHGYIAVVVEGAPGLPMLYSMGTLQRIFLCYFLADPDT